MTVQVELVLAPFSYVANELRVFLQKDPSSGNYDLPSAQVSAAKLQKQAKESLIASFFEEAALSNVEKWFRSNRYKSRVVEVFDKAPNVGAESVVILRALAIPEDLAPYAKGAWFPAKEALKLLAHSEEATRYIKTVLELIPHWARISSLVFEILPPVFSIQELRVIVSTLSNQEIDPGNFHRRLKRLDILRPLVSGQRVHRWEFVWERMDVVAVEGLVT